MLARANRLVRAADYRRLVRRGRRVATRNTVLYLNGGDSSLPARVGFIVAKTVGKAVERNLVRRRLKAVSYTVIAQLPAGTEVVIRALPGAAHACWETLRGEISEALFAEASRA